MREKKTSKGKRFLAAVLTALVLLSIVPMGLIEVTAATPEDEDCFTIILLNEEDHPVAGAQANYSIGVRDVVAYGDFHGVIPLESLTRDIAEATAPIVVEFTITHRRYQDFKITETLIPGVDDKAKKTYVLKGVPKTPVTVDVTDGNNPLSDVRVFVEGAETFDVYTDANGRAAFSVYLGEEYKFDFLKRGYIMPDVTKKTFTAAENFAVNLEQKGTDTSLTFPGADPYTMPYSTTDYPFKALSTNRKDGVLYSVIEGEDVVSIDDSSGLVTTLTAGTAKVKAVMQEGPLYLQAETTRTIIVNDVPDTNFAFAESGTVEKGLGEGSYTNTATGLGSGAVTYAIAGTAATIDTNSGLVTFVGPGTVTVTATKAADQFYKAAEAQYTLVIQKNEQTGFAFTTVAPADVWMGEKSFQNTATGGQTQGVVTYEVTGGADCATVDANGKLTFLKAGVVRVVATRPGDNQYADVTAEYTLTIIRTGQTGLRFTTSNPGSISYEKDLTFTNEATGGTIQPITYAVDNTEVATVDIKGVLSVKKPGTVVVTASQLGNNEYLPATDVQYTLTIVPGDPTLAFTTKKIAVTYGENQNKLQQELTLGTDISQTGITYTVSDETVAQFLTSDSGTPGKLTILKAGTVTVTGTRATDGFYKEKADTYTLAIEKAEQVPIAFHAPQPQEITYNDNNNQFTNQITTTSGNGVGVVSYEVVEGAEVATFANERDQDNGQLTIQKAGSVTVRATKAADDCYNATTKEYTLSIKKADQVLAFDVPTPNNLVYGNAFGNMAQFVGLHGNEEITYEIIAGKGTVAAAVNDQGELQFVSQGVGTVVVEAAVQADACYNEAKKTYTLTVDYLKAPTPAYTLTGEKVDGNTSGWYVGDVTIHAPEGYEISQTNNLEKNQWAKFLTVATQGANPTTVYLKNAVGITDAIAILGKDIRIDRESPEGLQVSYSQTTQDQLLESLSFGFYQAPATVTLFATDKISGIESFTYSFVEQALVSPSEQADTIHVKQAQMQEKDGGYEYSFQIPAQFRNKVFFKATDKAGLVSSWYSDQKVLVVDDISPKAKISYTGNSVRMVDGENKDVANGNADARYIYNGTVGAQIIIDEANFWPENGKVTVMRDGAVVTDCAVTGWSTTGNTHTLSITMEKDGDYQVLLAYGENGQDYSSNSLLWESEEYKGKEGELYYSSNIITVDTVKPVIEVAYDNLDAQNSNFYKADRTATLTVRDRNFRAAEMNIQVTGKDVTGATVPFALASKLSSWEQDQTDPAVWSARLQYDVEANYSVDIAYVDMADNAAEPFAQTQFSVDKTAPSADEIQITYSTPLKEWVLASLSFGTYNPSVTVQVTAQDITAGMDYIDWSYQMQQGASNVNKENESARVQREALVLQQDGKTAVATFSLTAKEAEQYRGQLTVSATDRAGNLSLSKQDNGKIVIVDTISPTRQVSYSPAKQVVDKTTLETKTNYNYTNEGANAILYYDNPMQVTVQVQEANFYPQDIALTVNDKRAESVTWEQRAGTDIWTAIMPFAADGDYVVGMTYLDRSNNEMKAYRSEQITVDTINPAIQVNYQNNNVIRNEGQRKYFDQQQTAIITVTERNFRADDIAAAITAKDVTQGNVGVQDYAGYLRSRSSWRKNGDVYTAQVNYAVDANYDFDIAYKDLALREAAEYTQDQFTVDTTAPSNLQITYSPSVLDTVLEALSFGFYNAQMTVTITAQDTTAGVNDFTYSYKTAAGVSGVNGQAIDQVIGNAAVQYAGSTATASFQIPQGSLGDGSQFNGTVDFRATDRSNNKTDLADTKRIVVDNIAPVISVKLNDPVQTVNETAYYASAAVATLTVTEANFYQDDFTVTVTKNGGAATAVEPGWTSSSTDIHTGTVTLEEEGDYTIHVTGKDHAGNQMEPYQSGKITVDSKKPVITISGIQNESANNDKTIGFTLTVEDENLDSGEVAPVLQAVVRDKEKNFQTITLTDKGTMETVSAGKKYVYTVENLETDAIYSLSCKVSDMSRNTTQDMLQEGSTAPLENLRFSVNRLGSTYMLDQSTISLNGSFVKEASDVVIYEINADQLSDLSITLFKNDTTIMLQEGVDYSLQHTGGNGQWNQDEYRVHKANFADDGVYRITTHTVDKAGNIAENTMDSKTTEIGFGVDKTAPNAFMTNVEDGATYPTENLIAQIEVSDNLKLTEVSAYLDGQQAQTWSLEDIQEKAANGQSFAVEIPGDSVNAHSLEVRATDAAGNETVVEKNNFYVTTDLWVRFYTNKPLLLGSVGGGVALAAAAVSLVIIRKNKIANK